MSEDKPEIIKTSREVISGFIKSHVTSEIAPTSLEVIGSKSIPTTEDDGYVKVVLSKEDLSLLISAMEFLTPTTDERRQKHRELYAGLRDLRDAAFGI